MWITGRRKDGRRKNVRGNMITYGAGKFLVLEAQEGNPVPRNTVFE